MSTRKLLISAAAAALMAGSAAALTVTQGDAGGAAFPGVTGATPLPGTAFTAAAVVAEEATLAATGSDMQIFELTVTSTGSFAASENYFVDLVISGGTFAATQTGSEVTNGDTTGTGITISGSSVQIAGQAQTGQVGENAVRYLVSNSPTAGDSFGIEVPVTFSGCPNDLSFTVSIETTGGVTFEEGTVSLATPALTCGNAYLGSIASDVVAGANDSVLTSPDFDTWAATSTSSVDDASDGLTAAPADTATSASLGVVTVAFDPAALTPAGGFLTSLDASSLPLTGLAAEVVSADFDVNVTTPAGIVDAGLLEGPEADVAFVAGVASLSDLVPGVLTTLDHIDNITLDVDGTTQIAQQPVTTTNGTLVFGAALGIVADEPIADATLDDINYEGVTCGTFDWVGDSSKPTKNIFRVTGAGAATTNVIATLTNSSEGINGSMTLTQAYDFTDPEVIITQDHLTADFGDFGRADVLFNFIGGATGIDCDRLMNSDSANIITAFGNNNSTATTTADGDD